MSNPFNVVMLACCLSLASLALCEANGSADGAAKDTVVQVLKAGGRYILRDKLCGGDRAPVEDRVHDVLARYVESHPTLELTISREIFADYMAEESALEFMRTQRVCDQDSLASSRAALDAAIRVLDD